MTTPELVPRVFFALRPEIKNCAYFISDFQILYPAGSVLILHNFYEKRQRYINLNEKSVSLELIGISPSRRFAAIILNAEKGQIYVIDLKSLKRRRTLNLPPDSTTNRFEDLAFTHDDVYLLAITGEPDWNLVLYNWAAGKLTSCTKAVASNTPCRNIQVYCSPTDSAEICIIGPGVFRLLSRNETVWRQYGFQKADLIDITTATWLTGSRILCGTSDGKLILIENGDVRGLYSAFNVNVINLQEKTDGGVAGSSSFLVIKSQSDMMASEDMKVRAMITFPKGFAYSCRSGYVFLFEKEGPFKYKKRNVFRILDVDLSHLPQTELNIVQHLSINLSQDKLLATTNRAQLYSVRLWGPDIIVAPEIAFKPLGEPLHHGPINAISMCTWKPVFATSGKLDHTIRLWNYETETVLFVKHFVEEIRSLHLHPTGTIIAIGFRERLDISSVLINDIQPIRSFHSIKACEVCLFSFSGQYLAAAHGDTIEILGTVLVTSLFVLKGHVGKIQTLRWVLDDKRLASCSTGGDIFIWDIVNGVLLHDIRTPDFSYLDIFVTADAKQVFAIDHEGSLKLFNSTELLKTIKIGHTFLEKILMSRSNLILFVTGRPSDVMVVKLPIRDVPEFNLYQYHMSSITQLKLSFDDQYLVTTSIGGTIIIWKVNFVDAIGTVQMDKNTMYSTDVLVNTDELQKKILMIKTLSKKLYELEMGQAREIKNTEISYSEKIKEIHEKYTQNIEELKEKIEHTETDHDKQLEEVKREIYEIKQKQKDEKENLIMNYTNKFTVEFEKVRDLAKLNDEMIAEFEYKVAALEKAQQEETDELIRVYEQQLAEVNNLLQKTYEENTKNIKEHEEIKQYIENDTNRELVEYRAKHEVLLKEEVEQNSRLKDEAAIMKKNYAEEQKERDGVSEILEQLQATAQKFQSTIHMREKDVADLKAEIVERDSAADEKDEKIFSLKKKVQELDKYKFVLEYKIKELNKEIDPKNREIREQKEQIGDMEFELGNLKTVNSSLELQLIELKEKINGTEKEIADYDKKHSIAVNAMKQIKVDIYLLYQDLENFKKLRDGMRALYHKYHDCEISSKEQYGESDIQKELLIKREFLEKTIKALRSTLLKKNKFNKSDSSKVYQDNELLLEELNLVRKDLKEATLYVESLENLLGTRGGFTAPSTAFNKMQAALTKQEEIRRSFQGVIDNAEETTEELKSKAQQMQNKFFSLIAKSEN